jgi:hypothetical protein
MKILLLPFSCLSAGVLALSSKAQSEAAILFELTWFYSAYLIEYAIHRHFGFHITAVVKG